MIDPAYMTGSRFLAGITFLGRLTRRARTMPVAAANTGQHRPTVTPPPATFAERAPRWNRATGWNRLTEPKPTLRERIFGEDPEGATLDYSPRSELEVAYEDLTPISELPSRPLKPATRVPTLAALDADVRNAFDARWDDALMASRTRLERLEASLADPHPVRAYRTAMAEDPTQRIDEICGLKPASTSAPTTPLPAP